MRLEPTHGQAPWLVVDVLRLVAAVAAAAGLCFLGWYQAAERADVGGQLTWANVSVGGLLVLGYAALRWLLAVRHAVGERRRVLLPDVRANGPAVGHGSLSVSATPAVGGDDSLVAGQGLERYHRPSCPMAMGRDWPAADRSAHEVAGRRPCGVCCP